VGDIVEMLGALPNDQVPAQMARAQAIALPTYFKGEAFPVMLLEGMAMGLPTIGSRYVGIPDIISDGETGLLVEPQDVEGLAGALEVLVSNPQSAAEMGRKGRLRAERLFSSEAMGRSMTALYTSVSELGKNRERLAGGVMFGGKHGAK
jgi:glycosyltransferase involved in cell wall biosynthesis